ncbi:MAG: hypothetical protein WAN11_11870, partial [Syntrophobacteraceae bacterium]
LVPTALFFLELEKVTFIAFGQFFLCHAINLLCLCSRRASCVPVTTLPVLSSDFIFEHFPSS